MIGYVNWDISKTDTNDKVLFSLIHVDADFKGNLISLSILAEDQT